MRYRLLTIAFAVWSSVAVTGTLVTGTLSAQDKPKGTESKPPVAEDKPSESKPKENSANEKWTPLLKSDSLENWTVTNFGGEGDVTVKEGVMTLDAGNPLSGITWTGKEFPHEGFEIRLEANRLEGGDFLCGLTFPVGEKHASLIGGGWGGGVVGLSSVDGNDASENSTSTFRDFKNGKWYKFRVRVDDKNVTAWVDDEKVFSQERQGHDFSVRAEVLGSRPLGFCTFMSKVAVKNFEWRLLPAPAGDTSADSSKPASEKSGDRKPKTATLQEATIID